MIKLSAFLLCVFVVILFLLWRRWYVVVRSKEVRIHKEYDKIAIDHILLAVHGYTQVNNNSAIDFSKEAKEEITYIQSDALGVPAFGRLLEDRTQFLHRAKPASMIGGWSFDPIYGVTGNQEATEGSMLGLMGINKQQKIISFAFRNSYTP